MSGSISKTAFCRFVDPESGAELGPVHLRAVDGNRPYWTTLCGLLLMDATHRGWFHTNGSRSEYEAVDCQACQSRAAPPEKGPQ